MSTIAECRWTARAICALLLVAAAALGLRPAAAQTLSTPTLTNASSPDELDAGPNTSYERESGVLLLGGGSGAFSTRYFGLVSTDNDAFFGSGPARTETLASNYTVAFTATAPRLYSLTIATRRTGDVNIRDDGGASADASGDVSAVSCSSSGGTVVSGGCALTDPGGPVTGGNSNLPYNQTNTLTVCGSSNGVSVPHSLNFTWSQSTTKSSTGFLGNADEGAIRLGGTSSVSAETAADYPGTPARTQSNDGHFVTVTITSLCGNGVIDSCGSDTEACDEGSANGAFGSCCKANCTFETAGTLCRSSAGVCDPAEACTGVSGACPADSFSPGGTPCRAGSGDVCDPTETCTGITASCPPDVVSPPSAACRGGSGDACDPTEFCTGVPAQPCPPDVVAPNTTVCNAGSGDACDPDELCTGAAGQPCPADSVTPGGTTCRIGSGDSCDPDEACTGIADQPCPADSVSGAFVVCRGPAGACDLTENCPGIAGQTCPADAKSTAVCRAAAGVCDVAESCDGVNDACPADALAPATTVCRPSGSTCDVPENCTGSGASCPADTGLPDTDADTVCDAIDNCDAIPNSSQDNSDSDPLGDACDPCTNIAPTAQDKAKLTLGKLLPPATDDKVDFKGFFTNMPLAPTIDPAANGMRFLVTDSAGNTPIDITIPGGAYNPATKAGWKVNGAGTSWKYKNAGSVVPLIQGIQKMQLRAIASTPGKYKFAVKGKNANYAVNQSNLPLVGTLVIDVPFAATGQCGEAQFPAAFPAKPSCVATGGGKNVKCK